MKSAFLITFLFLRSFISFAQDSLHIELPKDQIYVSVDKMPSFPGGEEMIQKFAHDNLIVPANFVPDKYKATRIYAQFIITPQGTIKNITLLRGSGNNDLDKAVIDMIKKMPNWQPGSHRGVLKYVQIIFPFKVE